MKVGFIGGGNMASAMIGGMIQKGEILSKSTEQERKLKVAKRAQPAESAASIVCGILLAGCCFV